MRLSIFRFFNIFCFACVVMASGSICVAENNPAPSLVIGAKVFKQRCVLCHGDDGMGEGILPLKIKDYPNTNLLVKGKTNHRDQVYKAVVYGGYAPEFTDSMPPYGQELTWTELESVTDFILFLRQNPAQAKAMLDNFAVVVAPTRQQGKAIFDTRCVLCHGPFGEGDGRMAKILKDPPPFDLTASRVPEVYLNEIIKKGGEAMGRSKHMPPWGDQLNEQELAALIQYLIYIRD